MKPRFRLCALTGLSGWIAVGTALAQTTNVVDPRAMPGYRLFDHNCAQCHGDDARGDEGPNLHGLTKSDTRIGKIIQNGIKGEMPAFGKKFSDEDVRDLTAWLRTLRE